jgi:hypothetical protein
VESQTPTSRGSKASAFAPDRCGETGLIALRLMVREIGRKESTMMDDRPSLVTLLRRNSTKNLPDKKVRLRCCQVLSDDVCVNAQTKLRPRIARRLGLNHDLVQHCSSANLEPIRLGVAKGGPAPEGFKTGAGPPRALTCRETSTALRPLRPAGRGASPRAQVLAALRCGLSEDAAATVWRQLP